MPIEILMPALSPTMTEGNLAKWLKKEGDRIKAGEVIAEIETDKATMEVEAVDEGILAKILIAEKTENVPINKLIALILEDGEDAASLDNYQSQVADTSSKNVASNNDKATEELKKHATPTAHAQDKINRVIASPLAKRVAEQENIDLTNICGTGPHGRIIKDDVLAAKANPNKSNCNITTKLGHISGRNPQEYIKVPNNNMRKVIAKRLCESKQTVPHFYLSIECQIDKLLKMRSEVNSATDANNPAYKISVNDIVIKAVAMALKAVPEANSSWTDEATLRYNNIDVSVAVAIDGGLITPIIRNADQKSLSEISNEMKDLAARAKQGKLMPEEFQGGGFSISNLGMYGIKNFNAIINPPQSCILAIGCGQEKPIVVNGNISIANIIEVTLSSDHRVVDGAIGANFLNAFRKFLENPMSMLV